MTQSLKSMMRASKLALGVNVAEFATPGIGYILKAAGCDYALLDMEHGEFGIETVKSVLRYFEAADLPAIVRVPGKEYHHIARVCDAGAEGIMVPLVATADEVREVVRCMKDPPQGVRGVGLERVHDRYRPGPIKEKISTANDRTVLVVLIESEQGVENVDEIAAVPGVDCISVGHIDLTVSLGVPGDYEHEAYRRAVERIAAAGRRHNLALGYSVETAEEARKAQQMGFRFLIHSSSDARLLRAALADLVRHIREGEAHGPALSSSAGVCP